MATTNPIVTISGFCQLAIWTNTCLRTHAPEEPVVTTGHAGIMLCVNESPLPAQRRAQVRMRRIESLPLRLRNHSTPPAFPVCTSGMGFPAPASRARVTAIEVSLILYPFWLKARALLTEAAPAAP